VRDNGVRTLRIDRTYRVVMLHPRTGADFVLVWVDHPGLNDGSMPPLTAVTEDDLLRKRCLLHVAASRARETLTVTGWGRLSRLLSQAGIERG
jgi:hypothetical protein